MNDNNFANMARMRSRRLPLKLNIKFSRKENLIQPSGEPQGQHLGEFQKRYGPIVNKLYPGTIQCHQKIYFDPTTSRTSRTTHCELHKIS